MHPDVPMLGVSREELMLADAAASADTGAVGGLGKLALMGGALIAGLLVANWALEPSKRMSANPRKRRPLKRTSRSYRTSRRFPRSALPTRKVSYGAYGKTRAGKWVLVSMHRTQRAAEEAAEKIVDMPQYIGAGADLLESARQRRTSKRRTSRKTWRTSKKRRTSKNPCSVAPNRLTAARRRRIPAKLFVFPERRAWPLDTPQRARAAINFLQMGRVASASDFAAIRNKIRRLWPGIWNQYGRGLSWEKAKRVKAKRGRTRARKKPKSSRKAA
jgi:hypothetical protein